jgi:hypothetical protein
MVAIIRLRIDMAVPLRSWPFVDKTNGDAVAFHVSNAVWPRSRWRCHHPEVDLILGVVAQQPFRR